jgi:hypothetical protein
LGLKIIFCAFFSFLKIYREKEDRIPNLENTWLRDPKERSKILNWMLEGLDRLLKNETEKEEERLCPKFSCTSMLGNRLWN